ncbi:MAG: hypothetical protein FJW27_10815, partial [Acidimicrobiia bacterium]|nr:hypothetical protein [Acidimicrobiia bacterium]
MLIGYPLAYQYLTPIRGDALPATADELIRMRGEGWLTNYSIGDTQRKAGLPLVDAFRWDTGVQAHLTNDSIDAAVSITTGTLGRPRVREDNAGKQISGRVGLHPLPGLVAGVSAARGPFGSRSAALAAGLPADDVSMRQATWGG